MAALTPVQHVAVHLFVVWIQFAQAQEDSVLAKPGDNVTLQCNSSTDAAVTKLKWKRPEMKHYVFYFSDNKPSESFQDPRYRGRVELKDPQMKNGNTSVLLKNVSINDTGKYHCLLVTKSSDPNLGVFEHSVHLFVSEGPTKEQLEEQVHRGHVGLGVSLGVVCLVVVVVGLVVKSKRAKEKGSAECIDEQEMSKLNT